MSNISDKAADMRRRASLRIPDKNMGSIYRTA